MKPVVSVVMPTYNRASQLRKALESLTRHTHRGFEVIVVDDSSTDGTSKVLSSFKRRVKVRHTDRNSGPAAARNLGIRHAQGTYIAFMDDDCTAAPNWLRDMVAAMQRHKKDKTIAGIAGIVLFPPDASVLMQAVYSMPQLDEGTTEVLKRGKERDTPNLSCTNSIWRRSVLIELNGFDETLRRGQDADLSYRAIKHGYRFRQIPKGAVTHHYRDTLLGFLRQQYRGGIGGGRLLVRDRHYFGKRQYIIFTFPAFIAAGIVFPPLYLAPLVFCRGWLKAYRITKDMRVTITSLFLEYVKYYANLLGIWRGILSKRV
jgi:glycosyltransferase involved in cell wall biosynthesis